MTRNKVIPTSWRYVEFQPGDGTRYRFAFGQVLDREGGDLWVVGYEGMRGGRLVEFLGSPLRFCHKRITKAGWKYPDQQILEDFIIHELVDDFGGDKLVNPWTCWALVQCFTETFTRGINDGSGLHTGSHTAD